jgi:benzoyl-CoA-dihydrodiol lyase
MLADATSTPAAVGIVDFRTEPSRYRHWRLSVDASIATLTLDVDPEGGITSGYQLKLNSYDLGVDIELYDAVQRLRFEHPEVGAVVVTSGQDRMFCAGANIRMLAGASHAAKVNFCKFTNETRNGIEDASAHSGQRYLAALNGTASGGGYELALACDHILLVDDNSSAVSLPEVPLLGVLPGTGGLTRVVDKRKVRRDLADVFSTKAEGVRGRTALRWGLVDELAPRSRLADVVKERAGAMAAASDRPAGAGAGSEGVVLTPLERDVTEDRVSYSNVIATLDRDAGTVEINIAGPAKGEPQTPAAFVTAGDRSWALATVRQLDDLILHLRTNEPELGTWRLRTTGDGDAMLATDEALSQGAGHWLVREIVLYWKRTLKRLDMTSRSLVALIGPGSCFTGTLFELALAADRSYQLDIEDGPTITLTPMNLGPYPMANGLTRLATRFLDDPSHLDELAAVSGRPLDAAESARLGLVTLTPDDIDWDDEVRLAIEERASFSPDALTGMEANLRFPGPETLETKIFGRLTAWQNWIFQRPNATGPEGGLNSYGTGHRADFDRKRV